MKKKAMILIAAVGLAFGVAGCGNQQIIDTTYNFDYAIIKLPNGKVVEGQVQSWRDFEDGDSLQIKINGVTYLTHGTNVTLISNNAFIGL